MKRTILLAGALFLLAACTSQSDLLISEIRSVRTNQHTVFHATTEGTVSPTTKVYADDQLRVLWNAEDRITIFNKSTYNSQFCFAGEDGDNAGGFDEIAPSGFVSGNTLGQIFAVYPYAIGNKINNDGNTITLNLPSEQRYKEHSFGIGANTMVAVTDNNFLAFKNLGGYLQLRLYGDNVKVSNIKIQGNNGEKIAGKANVAVGLGILPTVTMDNTATDAITLVCNPPVQLGTTAEQYTDFWFVIPPTTFSSGFTITVTDELGGVFQKATTKSLTITRSTIEWMSAIEVTPDYKTDKVVFADSDFKAYCLQNFDLDGDGEISSYEANEVEEIDVNTVYIASLRGIENFTNLRVLRCVGQINGTEWYYVFPKLLTSLDLSNNPMLTELYCQNNKLTSLDVSNNTELTILNCDNNQISSLDVSKNTTLQYLDCGSNQLTSLDLSNNTRLTDLICDLNQLTSLDVSKNTALQYMNCENNLLSSLDVSNNIELRGLRCEGNLNLREIWLHRFLTVIYISYDPQITTIKHKDMLPVNYDTLDSLISVVLTDINYYDDVSCDVYHYSDYGNIALWGETFDGPIALYKKNGVRWMNMRSAYQYTDDAHSYMLRDPYIPLLEGNHNICMTIAPTQSDSLKVFNDIVNFFTAIAYIDEGSVPYLKYVNSPNESTNYRINRIRADQMIFTGLKMISPYEYHNDYGLSRASIYDNKAIVFANDNTYSVNLDSYYDSFSNIIELFLHYISGSELNMSLYSVEDVGYSLYNLW